MIHSGMNDIGGVPVEVIRKRIRRINLRVNAAGGVVLAIPKGWGTLLQGETFLREKWPWVMKVRGEILSHPAIVRAQVTEDELAALNALLGELNAKWSARAGEEGVSWKVRKVKSLWGCCHWRDRYITYNAELAHAPRELVEYVVVHEYAHFAVHDHGPRFRALMDERLPEWKALRQRLNRRDWGDAQALPLPSPKPEVQRTEAKCVQLEFWPGL